MVVAALIWAAKAGYVDIVGVLVARGAYLHLVTEIHEMTALIWAAIEGHTEIVRILVNVKMNLDWQDKHLNATALIYAAKERKCRDYSNFGRSSSRP